AIPMMLIGYTVGGVKYIIYIIIMLCVVHALEAYVLNPKLMSSRTELPIFYTFVVLYVSEHLFGMWGLIVGIPVFTFLLDILGVKSDHIRRERLKKFREKVK
ncbi:AI-2E family transporter, partial [Lactobacillus salivarius]